MVLRRSLLHYIKYAEITTTSDQRQYRTKIVRGSRRQIFRSAHIMPLAKRSQNGAAYFEKFCAEYDHTDASVNTKSRKQDAHDLCAVLP